MVYIPTVNHSHVVCLHFYTCQKSSVWFFSVPRQLQNRSSSVSFILNWRMLQISDIELSDAAICSYGSKDISLSRKVDVIDFFIMSDELGKNSSFFDIPDCAGSVNRGSANQMCQLWIPIKGSEWSWKVIILILHFFTFLRFWARLTLLLSSMRHILRHYPEVAKRSGLSPAYLDSLILHQEWTLV